MKHNNRLYSAYLLALSLFANLAFAGPQALTDAQKKEVESIVKTYFVAHPQDLLDAVHALQKYQQVKQQKQAESHITQQAKGIFSSPNSPVIGNPKGDVTLVEFIDPQCGHCREMLPVIQKLITLDKQLRVVIKELPIFGERSLYASKVAIAASKQPQFEAFHAALLETKLPLTKKNVMKLARKAKLNTRTLKRDMKDKAIMEEIKANMGLARTIGIMGTPALIVGKRDGKSAVFIPGATSLESLQKAIAKIRNSSDKA